MVECNSYGRLNWLPYYLSIQVYFGIQHANACEKIANPLYCNITLWPWSGMAFVADIQSMCNRTMDPSTHAHNLFHFVGVLVHVVMV